MPCFWGNGNFGYFLGSQCFPINRKFESLGDTMIFPSIVLQDTMIFPSIVLQGHASDNISGTIYLDGLRK